MSEYPYQSITKNEYTLKDSFEFVSMIDKQDHNSFMCSFDIDSLFTIGRDNRDSD